MTNGWDNLFRNVDSVPWLLAFKGSALEEDLSYRASDVLFFVVVFLGLIYRHLYWLWSHGYPVYPMFLHGMVVLVSPIDPVSHDVNLCFSLCSVARIRGLQTVSRETDKASAQINYGREPRTQLSDVRTTTRVSYLLWISDR